jgi:hypothetical protein
VNRRILHDTEPLADFQADLCAQLDLLRFGNVHVVELLLALLSLLRLAHDAAELGVSGRADRKHRDDMMSAEDGPGVTFVAGSPTS